MNTMKFLLNMLVKLLNLDDPYNLNELYLYEDNKRICTILKVDKVSNSKIKRKNTIDYSKVINDDRETVEMEEK